MVATLGNYGTSAFSTLRGSLAKIATNMKVVILSTAIAALQRIAK